MKYKKIWVFLLLAVFVRILPVMGNEYKKPSEDALKKLLTSEQYGVTQRCETEPPFHNKYWDNKEPGIYVDVVTGEPLFSSTDKYDSGTGWPSFTKPLEKNNLIEKEDHELGYTRTEVKSKHGDSHLGHVFNDGPGPTHQRYCMNSASLRFVPVAKLKDEGLEKYLPLFEEQKKKEHTEIALLSGGCFWGVEELIRKLPGVISTRVGYTGGAFPNPTYEDVKKETTGHAEAVEITFDPKKISYEHILEYFFKLHDPTTLNRQGNDIGTSYRSSIFYENEKQKEMAQKVKAKVAEKIKHNKDKSKYKESTVTTEIVKASVFYPAEEYHQKYLQKNPGGYTCHFLRE